MLKFNDTWLPTLTVVMHLILFFALLNIFGKYILRNKKYKDFFTKEHYKDSKITLVWCSMIFVVNCIFIFISVWFKVTVYYNNITVIIFIIIVGTIVLTHYDEGSTSTTLKYVNWVINFSQNEILTYSFGYSMVLILLQAAYCY